ncbi:MAG: AAA family ATPase [Victivallales bacterium]|nr:AAA family ATPase [Victivallales bacterium]
MMKLPISIPEPPDWTIDWKQLHSVFGEWFEEMIQTPQHPEHHGEGDVFAHTQLVCENLVALKEFRCLPVEKRQILFTAALLHDIGKIRTTKTDDMGITAPHHASTGAKMAREYLWKQWGMAGIREKMLFRETICQLIRLHGKPPFFFELAASDNTPNQGRSSAYLLSMAAHACLMPDFSLRLLFLLAKADCMGKICADKDEIMASCETFAESAQELNCLDAQPAFSDDYSRYAYLASKTVSPNFKLFDPTWGAVTMLCGLPGTGKDTWIHRNLPDIPMVSLDEIRRQLKISPEEPQGKVVQTGFEMARGYLRAKTPFVWNATNVRPDTRLELSRLFIDYGAAVRIVYLETTPEEQERRNHARQAVVPEDVVERMRNNLEPPRINEAHSIEWLCV